MSNCPMGADYDPRAPWNLPDYETRYEPCEECGGKGFVFCAIDRRTGNEVEVTEAKYKSLPVSEELAIARGRRYYRSDKYECDGCNGTGEVEVDDSNVYECDPAWRD